MLNNLKCQLILGTKKNWYTSRYVKSSAGLDITFQWDCGENKKTKQNSTRLIIIFNESCRDKRRRNFCKHINSKQSHVYSTTFCESLTMFWIAVTCEKNVILEWITIFRSRLSLTKEILSQCQYIFRIIWMRQTS